MTITRETTAFLGWDTCHKLSDGQIELIVTADIGPRIIHAGLVGGGNLLGTRPDHVGKTGGDDFRVYGGHRLWHAPEQRPRTYQPDNAPVTVSEVEDGLRFDPPVEAATQVQKSITVQLLGDGRVRLTHAITNHSLWDIPLSIWALTIMAQNGTAIMPLPPPDTHENALLPSAPLVLWPYTDLRDERLTFGREHILIRQEPDAAVPVKLGLNSPRRWLAYTHEAGLFVKTFGNDDDIYMVDFGSSTEIFTNNLILELETLGSYVTLAPGATTQHIEHWAIHPSVGRVVTEDDVRERVLPLVEGS